MNEMQLEAVPLTAAERAELEERRNVFDFISLQLLRAGRRYPDVQAMADDPDLGPALLAYWEACYSLCRIYGFDLGTVRTDWSDKSSDLRLFAKRPKSPKTQGVQP